MNHSYEVIRQEILQALHWPLSPWSNETSEGSSSPGPDGATRVRESITALGGALKALGDRDRNGTRLALHTRRNKLKDRLETHESLGRWLKGPGGIELVHSVLNAREKVDAASAALLCANRENVRSLREALDLANVDLNDVMLSIDKLRTSELGFPNKSIVDPALVRQAKLDTALIASEPRRAVAYHEALNQGLAASADLSALWICFEPSGEAFELRWERWIAAHPEAQSVAA